MQRSQALSAVESMPSDARDTTLRLFETHATALYRFCRCALGRADEAEDVVQETFLKLLRHLEADGSRANLKAWLFTVAANACRDRTRWRARWIPWRPEADARSVEPAGESADLERARRALSNLSKRDRLLLSLRAQGLSYREIATAAGLAPVSVGRLLARAAQRWRRMIDSQNE